MIFLEDFYFHYVFTMQTSKEEQFEIIHGER